MTPRGRQEAEIKTIKPRNITINLSDADVERLFGKTYVNGITPSELIEGFLGDLLDGTYSNGSDERMLADEYFERCCYGMGADYTFMRWALDEMLQSMSGSGESEECAEDDEQFEP